MKKHMLVRAFQALTMDQEERSDYELWQTATEIEEVALTIQVIDEHLTDLHIGGMHENTRLLLAQAAFKAQLMAVGIAPEYVEALFQSYTLAYFKKANELLH